MLIKKEFIVDLDFQDYMLLVNYGFYFEKNIQEYIHEMADATRDAIAEYKKDLVQKVDK